MGCFHRLLRGNVPENSDVKPKRFSVTSAVPSQTPRGPLLENPGSKGPERTERLALETSEESIERANNGINGHLALYWDRLGDGDGKERSDQTSSSPKGVTTRRQVLLSRCRLCSSTRRGRLN
ncbi:unnamed protein product [Leuciscus chuanchicus]